jgi:hypothetical protein
LNEHRSGTTDPEIRWSGGDASGRQTNDRSPPAEDRIRVRGRIAVYPATRQSGLGRHFDLFVTLDNSLDLQQGRDGVIDKAANGRAHKF